MEADEESLREICSTDFYVRLSEARGSVRYTRSRDFNFARGRMSQVSEKNTIREALEPVKKRNLLKVVVPREGQKGDSVDAGVGSRGSGGCGGGVVVKYRTAKR